MGADGERDARDAFGASMNELLHVPSEGSVAITVDMQRDYLDAEVATAPVASEDASRVVESTARFLDVCRGAGIPVIHCYVSRRPAEGRAGHYSTAFGRASRRARLSQSPTAPARSGPDRVTGSANAQVMPALVAESDLHVDAKRQMDSFYGTDLEVLLGAFQPSTILIAGINTDTCVYATALGASHRGYAPVVISDCAASYRGADHHRMALELMSRTMAWVVSLDEIVRKLRSARPSDSLHEPDRRSLEGDSTV